MVFRMPTRLRFDVNFSTQTSGASTVCILSFPTHANNYLLRVANTVFYAESVTMTSHPINWQIQLGITAKFDVFKQRKATNCSNSKSDKL